MNRDHKKYLKYFNFYIFVRGSSIISNCITDRYRVTKVTWDGLSAYLLKYTKKIYNIAMISNLPTIMLAVSISFEPTSRFTDVMPAVRPVVERAETASNRASSKWLFVRELKTDPVIKAIET
jgi:hypothetical protein